MFKHTFWTEQLIYTDHKIQIGLTSQVQPVQQNSAPKIYWVANSNTRKRTALLIKPVNGNFLVFFCILLSSLFRYLYIGMGNVY
jgi:hypothetical protein